MSHISNSVLDIYLAMSSDSKQQHQIYTIPISLLFLNIFVAITDGVFLY